ncbi:hypothetical protein ACM64Y_14480 [Novispirillum sp. DQ9]|uniref:hypothetical protein n=1 Tax=Novispirillum sp. DQ9 TaxID=3398612 RepID=UPI003C79D218
MKPNTSTPTADEAQSAVPAPDKPEQLQGDDSGNVGLQGLTCSENTRFYIRMNADDELFCLIDFLEGVSRLDGSFYRFGCILEDAIFDIAFRQEEASWHQFRLPVHLLNAGDGPEPHELQRLWLQTQPEELKVYWECNQILRRMWQDKPSGLWEPTRAGFYVAQLFSHGTRPQGWAALMEKSEFGRVPIDPPQGYAWIEPSFKLPGTRDLVPHHVVPEFNFGDNEA